MPLILLVEDEKRMQSIVADTLLQQGYQVLTANDGLEAMILLQDNAVDLMILDIMMPYMDGYSVCRLAREMSNMPIIIVTAKQEEEDKLKGYELGADDYVAKPFSLNVLMAKVRALLKRAGHPQHVAERLQGGCISLYPVSRKVYVDGSSVEMTHTEFELLHLFMKNQNQVFTRDQLLNRIWGYDYEGTTRTVDVHVKNLRQKLGKAGDNIVTLIRSGYKFEEIEDESR